MVAFTQITALLVGAASVISASPTPADLSSRQSVAGVQPAFSCNNETIQGHISPYPAKALCMQQPFDAKKYSGRPGQFKPLVPATIINTNGTMGENLNLCGASGRRGEEMYIYPICCGGCQSTSRSYYGTSCVAAKGTADVSDTTDLVQGVLNTALKSRERTQCVNSGN